MIKRIIYIIELIIGTYLINFLINKLFAQGQTYPRRKKKSTKKSKIAVVKIINNPENFPKKELNGTNYAALPIPTQIVKKYDKQWIKFNIFFTYI